MKRFQWILGLHKKLAAGCKLHLKTTKEDKEEEAMEKMSTLNSQIGKSLVKHHNALQLARAVTCI